MAGDSKKKSISMTKKKNKKQDNNTMSSLAVPAIKPPSPPPEEYIKHPLEHTWSLWYYTNQSKNWEENQVKIHSFSTVEDFWCLYHHAKLPTELEMGHDYAIFKEPIPPIWEHKANANGGRWLLVLDRARKQTDDIWLDIVLTMIGENFVNNDQVAGAVVTIRQKNKIGVWTKDFSNEQAIMEIGKKLKNVVGHKFRIGFHKHNFSHNNMYTI